MPGSFNMKYIIDELEMMKIKEIEYKKGIEAGKAHQITIIEEAAWRSLIAKLKKKESVST